ncbi:hypothetical protein [Paenibacillus sp. HW567]|uniref:hypothetical protein n=1 Tax=Paenibacillus sp. HW567 TaxID=1034769 RepID=UPI0003679970
MLGTKPEEGIREPMRWSADITAAGQTAWEPGSNNAGQPGINAEINCTAAKYCYRYGLRTAHSRTLFHGSELGYRYVSNTQL